MPCHAQENIKNCVVIIYDPSRTRTTGLALRAFRLTDTFMALYKVATCPDHLPSAAPQAGPNPNPSPSPNPRPNPNTSSQSQP